MKRAPERQLRLLALHGFRTSSAMFETQVREAYDDKSPHDPHIDDS